MMQIISQNVGKILNIADNVTPSKYNNSFTYCNGKSTVCISKHG